MIINIDAIVDGSYGNIFTVKFTNTWTGAINSSWENPGNWSCGTAPDNFTDVKIKSGATVVINSNVIIGSLNIESGATVTVTSGHTINVLR